MTNKRPTTYDQGFSKNPQTGNARVKIGNQEIVLRKGTTVEDLREKSINKTALCDAGRA